MPIYRKRRVIKSLSLSKIGCCFNSRCFDGHYFDRTQTTACFNASTYQQLFLLLYLTQTRVDFFEKIEVSKFTKMQISFIFCNVPTTKQIIVVLISNKSVKNRFSCDSNHKAIINPKQILQNQQSLLF